MTARTPERGDGEFDFVLTVSARSPDTLYFTSGDAFYTLSDAFRPDTMSYVDRRALAARLRALAEIVDPPPYDLYTLQQEVAHP